MRPCEEGKPCQYIKYDNAEDCQCCAIDFDGENCPYIKPWGKRKYREDHEDTPDNELICVF